MKKAASDLDFEKAAELRDEIQRLKTIQQVDNKKTLINLK